METNRNSPEKFLFRARAGSVGGFFRLEKTEHLDRVQRLVYALLAGASSNALTELSGRSADEMSLMVQQSNEHCDISSAIQVLADSGLSGYALSLVSQFSPPLPDELVTQLRRIATTEQQTCLRSEEAFQPILKLLSKYGKRIAVIKGPAVAASVYPAQHLRHSADLDIVVDAEVLQEVFNELCSAGFRIKKDGSALFRAGHCTSAEDVLMQPSDEFAACDALPLSSAEGLDIDLKIDPLEYGLHMVEIRRFFDDLTTTAVMGVGMYIPSNCDQMLIACCHLHKDKFQGLRLLLDIHLLAKALSPADWTELLRRSRTEAVETSVWAALCLAKDRLGSPVPEFVLEGLTQGMNSLALQLFFLRSYRFMWNQNSICMLLLNAATSSDCARKVKALARTVFPAPSFLTLYYGPKVPTGTRWCSRGGIILYPLLWCLHLFTLCAPAGVVRRTLGAFMWKES